MELKTALALRIVLMIGGNADKWWPHADANTVKSIANSAGLVANSIAQRLIDDLAQNPEIDEERWKLMVKEATRCAIEPLVNLGPDRDLGYQHRWRRSLSVFRRQPVSPLLIGRSLRRQVGGPIPGRTGLTHYQALLTLTTANNQHFPVLLTGQRQNF
jgi:hypothetical protein